VISAEGGSGGGRGGGLVDDTVVRACLLALVGHAREAASLPRLAPPIGRTCSIAAAALTRCCGAETTGPVPEPTWRAHCPEHRNVPQELVQEAGDIQSGLRRSPI
jgi:hypothetical protein